MGALKAIKINQNDGKAVFLCLPKTKYRVTKGFKFHARPQTGAYSCLFSDDQRLPLPDVAKRRTSLSDTVLIAARRLPMDVAKRRVSFCLSPTISVGCHLATPSATG